MKKAVISIITGMLLTDFLFQYLLLDRDIFYETKQCFTEEMEQEVYQYSDEVKGAFVTVESERDLFPPDLVRELEEMLYQSLDRDFHKLTWEEISKSRYFEFTKKYGSEEFALHSEEIEEYRKRTGAENCENMFRITMDSEQDCYVFLEYDGGSDGHRNVRLAIPKGEEYVTICEFETQNEGYGTVIRYEQYFYYIYLESNYVLKNFDGVHIYKLGVNADRENILIKYLPSQYNWKNIYDTYEGTALNNYIESIKDDITSDTYLENGNESNEWCDYHGDEKPDETIQAQTEEYYKTEYYKIDFLNTGIPIYITYATYVPSNNNFAWHKRIHFYLNHPQYNIAVELKQMALADEPGPELVQLWFKELEGKVYTFCLYHVSDYNYVLNTVLFEENRMSRVRTDILCPQRYFTLTEGERFQSF